MERKEKDDQEVTKQSHDSDVIPDMDSATDDQCADTLLELRPPFGGCKLWIGKYSACSVSESTKKKLSFDGKSLGLFLSKIVIQSPLVGSGPAFKERRDIVLSQNMEIGPSDDKNMKVDEVMTDRLGDQTS